MPVGFRNILNGGQSIIQGRRLTRKVRNLVGRVHKEEQL